MAPFWNQTPEPPPLPVPDVTPFLDTVRHCSIPTQDQYLQMVQAMGVLLSLGLIVGGVIYLMYGWKIFKVLVVINAAVLGALLGAWVGGVLQGSPPPAEAAKAAEQVQAQGGNMPLFGAIAISLLMAVLALPLMKYAVSLMGGLAGSLLGYSAWHYISHAAGAEAVYAYAPAGALVGLVTMGLLAFLIFRVVIIIMTSFQGSLLAITGLLGVMMHFNGPRDYLLNSMTRSHFLLPLMVIVPAIIGLAFQHTGPGPAKKPAPAAPTPAKKPA
jgi:MFS family permease